ncbi:hypothetical protein AGRA3207_003444 [Actinomadura graeca]|uniref:Uncharacterized protein n=1 Tax=Actinomadura graeca TaxID=2750812 RepID=A0ABX8QUI2_9ACTN|nr:hypothetical protein [Actinomadura graeca]QXJ22445.1 hypothetical protein AGRA3207_003444 [Actinomadura graeca]
MAGWKRIIGITGGAILATTLTTALPATTAHAATPTRAACEFATYQYVFTGQDGTWRDVPGGNVQGYLYNGDLVNSGFNPSNTGWIQGNIYTSGGTYKGTGYVLRGYLSYVRSWC